MGESINRTEFLRQLECLLQGIPEAEREEALQYYNDYFDDAGSENEQNVIEALGNPARVAENIRRELLENGYGETPLKKAVASDCKLIKYGKAENRAETLPPNGDGAKDGSAHSGGKSGQSGKRGWPWWAVALLVSGLVGASPGILAFFGTLAGIIIAWFAIIFAAGMVSFALFVVFGILFVTGILCMSADPFSGAALVGGGLLCAGAGILALMLTVAMAGIVTPAVGRGIAFLCGRLRARK